MRKRASLLVPLVALAAAAAAAGQEPDPQPDPAPPAAEAAPEEAAPEEAAEAAPEEPAPAEPAPGFLGISMAPAEVPASDPPRAHVAVTAVVPGSPAEAAGLEEGDVLVALDGEPLTAPPNEVLQRFGEQIRARGAGAALTLTVRRPTLSVRTFVDEAPTGPGRDGSGRRAWAELLPDLEALLREHEGQLVQVRARAYDRERDVTVVLAPRPEHASAPLPPNATLRPDLEALDLDPAAALAGRLIQRAAVDGAPVAAAYEDLLARLERSEQVRDDYRLATVRYLHRDPLRLPGATRQLATQLRRVLGGPDDGVAPDRLLEVARLGLGAPRAALPTGDGPALPPAAPQAGAAPADYARYAARCLALARRWAGEAFAALSDAERAHLAASLPTLAEKFTEHLYLHEDQDRDRYARHARAVQLLARVDRGALLSGLEALLPFANPAFLTQMRADLQAAEAAGQWGAPGPYTRGRSLFFSHGMEETGGSVYVGSSDENEYRSDFDVIIDLGGDDRYHRPAAGARPDRPAALVVDLGGNDRYQANEPYAQAGALMGVALLVDAAGDDAYTTSVGSAQGFAAAGAALLVDLAGDDVYRGPVYVQGAGLVQGLGALLDGGGDDLHQAGLYAQGCAGPGALGALLTRGGDDRYAALGSADCSYGDAGTYRAFSQGSAVGFRSLASGGLAVLLDDGGRDLYEAGNFSQGGGYYYGWGLLADLGGAPDVYEGSRYAQGFAAHQALGSFWDDGGDDRYRGWVGAQQSASWDETVTCFLDDAGDDRYQPGPGFSIGAAAHNGFSLFVDQGGRDRYKVSPARSGPNDYHGGSSVAVFLDAGGDEDAYEGGGLADDRAAVAPEFGIALDLPGPLDRATDDLLDQLLPPPAPEPTDRPEDAEPGEEDPGSEQDEEASPGD